MKKKKAVVMLCTALAVALSFGGVISDVKAPREEKVEVSPANSQVEDKPCYITINGKKTVLVESKEAAEEVMEEVISNYKQQSGNSPEEIMDVEIVEETGTEKAEIKPGENVPEVLSVEEAESKLMEMNAEGELMTVIITAEKKYPENPLDELIISSPYGPRWGRMHYGVDFAIDYGSEIYAVESGTVSFAGYSGGYGNLITIEHEDGVQTQYAHCSTIIAEEGQLVEKGEVIGCVGSTGNSTGPHLHFEVIKDGIKVNPMDFLAPIN